MTGSGGEREFRQAPPSDRLKSRHCPVLKVLAQSRAQKAARAKIGLSWYRLSGDIYANTFFASKGSRFTPSSFEFPCAYFAETATTCFAEKFGDSLAKHAETNPGKPFAISADVAAATGLYEVMDQPELKLCDLTDESTLLMLGLDLATVYAPDLGLTQRWAEAIARMDINFDGIRFLSRHTHKKCQVLWDRPRQPPLSGGIVSDHRMPLLDAPFAWEVAGKVGVKLSFAGV